MAIVLHWGDRTATSRCVRALLESSYPNFSVLVVDNGTRSDWSSVEDDARVEVLHAPRNEGWAGGNNLGLGVAQRGGAAFALLVNNDAVVARDVVERLVRCALGDPRIAITGARLEAEGAPGRDIGSHGRLTYGPFLVQIATGEGAAPPSDAARDVDWVSGACILVRLASLERFGLLDEEFFLYCEDVDWCERARRAGQRVVFDPTAVVSHRPPHSLDAVRRRSYFLARNGLLFIRKHGRPLQRAKIIVLSLILPFASLTRRLLSGEPLSPALWAARGVADGLLRRPPRLLELGLRASPD